MSQWEQRAASRSVKNFALVENTRLLFSAHLYCRHWSLSLSREQRLHSKTSSRAANALSFYLLVLTLVGRQRSYLYLPFKLLRRNSSFLECLTRNLFLSLQRRQFRLYCSECSCDWRQYSLTLSFRSISRLRL